METATVSRCSCRHAANPLLTNEDGKQEAKEDDDEREIEQHGDSLTRDPGDCQGGRTLDICTRMNNNPAMSTAKPTPVAVVINLARSLGATG